MKLSTSSRGDKLDQQQWIKFTCWGEKCDLSILKEIEQENQINICHIDCVWNCTMLLAFVSFYIHRTGMGEGALVRLRVTTITAGIPIYYLAFNQLLYSEMNSSYLFYLFVLIFFWWCSLLIMVHVSAYDVVFADLIQSVLLSSKANDGTNPEAFYDVLWEKTYILNIKN